jgi:hypothetical protein
MRAAPARPLALSRAATRAVPKLTLDTSPPLAPPSPPGTTSRRTCPKILRTSPARPALPSSPRTRHPRRSGGASSRRHRTARAPTSRRRSAASCRYIDRSIHKAPAPAPSSLTSPLLAPAIDHSECTQPRLFALRLFLSRDAGGKFQHGRRASHAGGACACDPLPTLQGKLATCASEQQSSGRCRARRPVQHDLWAQCRTGARAMAVPAPERRRE